MAHAQTASAIAQDEGTFEWVPDSGEVAWSDSLAYVFGVAPEDFAGTVDAYLDSVHPDDRAQVRRSFEAILATHPRSFSVEHRIVRADGHVRIVNTHGEIVNRHDGPARFAGICRDVTEQRAGDSTLAESISLLHATLQATVDGILVVDRSGRIAASNERFRAMWRIPLALVGRHSDAALLEFVLDQLVQPQAFLDKVQELYANPERESFDVVRFKDGRVFERYSRPQRVGDAIVGRVWSFRDVTERERLLARQTFLIDASRLLAALELDSALEAVARVAVPYLGSAMVIDLVVEERPHRLLGHSIDPRGPVPDVLPEPAYSAAPTMFDEAEWSYLAVPLVAKDHRIGVMVFLATRPRRYTLADLGVAEELATRISLAVENARLLRDATNALRARDEFLAIAAHEIRGPLTAIHLAVQTLHHTELPRDVRERTYELVEREDRRLARFVDDLIDLGRVRTGALRIDLEEVDLAQVVRDAVSRMTPEINRSSSTVTIHADRRVVGMWDRFRLDQVVVNLLDNAIKFGLGRPIDICVDEHEGRGRMIVADRGLGVPPDRNEAIFEPFERGVSIRHYGGLGLGLFIVRTIVSRLDGTVRVEQRREGGSRFIVELPIGRWP